METTRKINLIFQVSYPSLFKVQSPIPCSMSATNIHDLILCSVNIRYWIGRETWTSSFHWEIRRTWHLWIWGSFCVSVLTDSDDPVLNQQIKIPFIFMEPSHFFWLVAKVSLCTVSISLMCSSIAVITLLGTTFKVLMSPNTCRVVRRWANISMK